MKKYADSFYLPRLLSCIGRFLTTTHYLIPTRNFTRHDTLLQVLLQHVIQFISNCTSDVCVPSEFPPLHHTSCETRDLRPVISAPDAFKYLMLFSNNEVKWKNCNRVFQCYTLHLGLRKKKYRARLISDFSFQTNTYAWGSVFYSLIVL